MKKNRINSAKRNEENNERIKIFDFDHYVNEFIRVDDFSSAIEYHEIFFKVFITTKKISAATIETTCASIREKSVNHVKNIVRDDCETEFDNNSIVKSVNIREFWEYLYKFIW